MLLGRASRAHRCPGAAETRPAPPPPVPPPRGRSPAGKRIASARKLRGADGRRPTRLPLSRRRPRAEATGAPPTWTAPAAPRPSRSAGPAPGKAGREQVQKAGAAPRGAGDREGTTPSPCPAGAHRPALGGGGDLRGPSCPASSRRRALPTRTTPRLETRAAARGQRRPRPTLVVALLIQTRVPAPAASGRRRRSARSGSPPPSPTAPRAPAAVGRADLASPRRRPSKHGPYDCSRPEAERRKPRIDERPLPKPNMAP